ncbi:Uncharacterized protein AB751O23_AB_00180 [Chlamydiales bacterium SCGC AB-751-O23]|jgi:oligoribonuclease|nr:Uncharacterized protein AB751O23_AB_00180 [Chlamydiales bacterium SCGC AB-751-O23]
MKGIFLDIESNGLDPRRHEVIEIAFVIRHLKSGETLETFETLAHIDKELWKLSDTESLKVNGFTYDQLKNAPNTASIGEEIHKIFTRQRIVRGQAFFICQNPSFDRAFFSKLVPIYQQEKYNWPYHWLDLASMYWGKTSDTYLQSPGKEPLLNLSKNFIAKQLGLPPESSPHKALNGVEHLIACYEKLIGFKK